MLNINPGDTVTRMLAGTIPMKLKVSTVSPSKIVCGPWEFCALTGAEIDDDLGWGPPPQMTGSYLDFSGNYTDD
jgi:hypothetical protein